MATAFHPSSAGPPAFLFANSDHQMQRDTDRGHDERSFMSRARRERMRIALCLCEAGDVPAGLSRAALARACGLSLARTKRIIGLLCVSSVVDLEDGRVTVRDWTRLRAFAGLAAEPDERPEEADAEAAQPLTVTGEPACFV